MLDQVLYTIENEKPYNAVAKLSTNLGKRTRKRLHKVRKNFVNDWSIIRYRLWKQQRLYRYQAIADPFKTINVSPKTITHCSAVVGAVRKNRLADVKSGSWDTAPRQFDELAVHKCFVKHFDQGERWEEIEFIQECAYGNRAWGRHGTPKEVFKKCEYYDGLFDRLKAKGFQSQEELTGNQAEQEIKRGGDVCTHIDNIVVDISRDGDILFVDGKHRLSIAKILNIETVPVNVLVRHRQWQLTRERIHEGTTSKNVGSKELHPDLYDLIP